MDRAERNCSASIQIRKFVSVLPNDYSQLTNIPTVNGVSLTGNLTAKSLNLLSSDANEYTQITLTDASQKAMSILAVSGNGETAKIAVDDFIGAVQQMKTVDELDESAKVGTYQKVIIKISED